MPCSLVRLFVLLVLATAVPAVIAQTDPPGRVGRVSLSSDGVTLKIGDAVATGGTALNWPVSTGAEIATGRAARAEVRVGSTAIRLNGDTTLEFAELSDERIWLRLARGSIALSVRNAEHAAEMTVDTVQGRIRFDGAGQYRVDANAAMASVSATAGTARIEGLGLIVAPGERIQFFGGADRNYVAGRTVNDEFGQWVLVRDRQDARAGSGHGSPEMTGHEELQNHGTWRETPEYGPLWFPRDLPPDWAPYRWGHWAWIAPWGWTWIDHAPWGFAPSHFGRWVVVGGNWAWTPGSYSPRPVFSPALVVWMGNPGWQVSFSFGSAPAIGWFPLGPRDIYYPPYRCSLRHVHHVNVTHITNITQIVTVNRPPARFDHYTHRGRGNAVTIVPGHTVTTGAPVARSLLPRPEPAMLAAPTAATPLLTAPTRVPGAPKSAPALPTPTVGLPAAPARFDDAAKRRGDEPASSGNASFDPRTRDAGGPDRAAPPLPYVTKPTHPAPQPLPAQSPVPLRDSADSPPPRPAAAFREPATAPVREPAPPRANPEPLRMAPAAAPPPQRPVPASDGQRDARGGSKGNRDSEPERPKAAGGDERMRLR